MNGNHEFQALVRLVQEELSHAISEVSPDIVDEFLHKLLQAKRIFITGKGRTGLQMESFAMRLMHLGLQVHVIGNVTTPAITPGDILVIGTASGRTPSLLLYAQIAHESGIEILSITANADNLISKLSTVNVIIPAPTHKNNTGLETGSSIQPMGGLFESGLILLLNIMVLQLMDQMKISEAAMIARHANIE